MAINWKLGDDGVLTIQGDGRMPDYGCGGRAMAPWNDEQDRIRHIFIGDGITEIGMRAFEGCEKLQSVDLPETVVRIHARAFYGCKNLTQVHTAAKDTRICYLNSPGLRAWTEARRLEELAREQAEAEREKSLKEQKAKEGQEKEEQSKTREQAAAEQREKNGQVLLRIRKDKNGNVVLEVWKDKNGQLLEVRTGRYGQVVEVRKDANGRVLEVQKIKNGEVRRNTRERSRVVAVERGRADERTVKRQEAAVEKPVKEQGSAVVSVAREQNSGDKASELRKIRGKNGPETPEIRFGLNSFYNVPWAKQAFGDFYIADGTAYACLSGKSELTVPEGVHTLGSFVFKDTEAESITLPQSLVTIRAFAFADSKVQSLDIPGKVSNIEDHAFADSRLTYLEFSEHCSCSLREGTFARSLFPYKKCVGFPELFALRSFQNRTNYGGFRSLRVVKKKSAGGKKTVSERTADPAMTGSTKTGIYGVPKIDVARHLMKKMSDGNVIIMIRCEGNRISRVESFLWDKDEKLINEYLMYPCTECGEEDMYEMVGKDETYTVPGNMDDLSIYRDSFTWQEKTDFYDAFPEEDAYLLERQGGLRRQEAGVTEQWFWSADRENFGGPLELEFLKYWNRLHLLHVDTVEECRNRFSGLSFVPI